MAEISADTMRVVREFEYSGIPVIGRRSLLNHSAAIRVKIFHLGLC